MALPDTGKPIRRRRMGRLPENDTEAAGKIVRAMDLTLQTIRLYRDADLLRCSKWTDILSSLSAAADLAADDYRSKLTLSAKGGK